MIAPPTAPVLVKLDKRFCIKLPAAPVSVRADEPVFPPFAVKVGERFCAKPLTLAVFVTRIVHIMAIRAIQRQVCNIIDTFEN